MRRIALLGALLAACMAAQGKEDGRCPKYEITYVDRDWSGWYITYEGKFRELHKQHGPFRRKGRYPDRITISMYLDDGRRFIGKARGGTNYDGSFSLVVPTKDLIKPVVRHIRERIECEYFDDVVPANVSPSRVPSPPPEPEPTPPQQAEEESTAPPEVIKWEVTPAKKRPKFEVPCISDCEE